MPVVLVTGANGLLGSSLVPYLRATGQSVIGISRQSGTDMCADFRDPGEAIRCLSLVNPDTIINLAAMTDVDACERDRGLAYSANVTIVENIASWIRLSGSNSHLVQISTDQVYDGPGPHREDDVTPTNVYGNQSAQQKRPRQPYRAPFFAPIFLAQAIALAA